MKATKHRPLAEGFTLLEIMIALAIIGTTVTVILHTVNFHADIMHRNTVETSMYQAAKEKLSELERNRAVSSGKVTGTALAYEKTITDTGDPGIVEIRAVIKGHGKKIALTELVRAR